MLYDLLLFTGSSTKRRRNLRKKLPELVHELEQFETIKRKPPQEQNVADVIETLSIVVGGVSVIADKLDGVENTLKGVQSALRNNQVQPLPINHE